MSQPLAVNLPSNAPAGSLAGWHLAWIDAAVAAGIVLALSMLQPAMLDGDGLDYASAAIYPGPASATEMKHPLYVPLLSSIHRTLDTLGLSRHVLATFCLFSHVMAAGLYLSLARGPYQRLLRGPFLPRLCSLGVVASYGVLSRAVTVEVYLPALLADVLLIHACLTRDLERGSTAAVIALMTLLATSAHVANLAMIPGVAAILVARLGPRRALIPLVRIALVGLVAALFVVGLLRVRRGFTPWPLDPTPILPGFDPEPAMTTSLRLARAAFGFARSIVYLPGRRELTLVGLAVPAAIVGLAMLFLAYLARHARLDRAAATRLALPLAAIVIPVAALGIRYYPSDVERWIFLTPAVWLLVGLALDHYTPRGRSSAPSRRAVIALAAAAIPLLAIHNARPLYSEARSSRELNGLHRLAALARPSDLVVSPSGVRGRVLGLYLPSIPAYENLVLYDIAREFVSTQDVAAKLRARVSSQLASGGRVLVYGLFDEQLEAGAGFPWAHLPPDRGSEFFRRELGDLRRVALIPPDQAVVGLFELVPPEGPAPAPQIP